MKISKEGIDFIKRREGFFPVMYRDLGGRETIGYGHLIKPGEKFRSLTQDEGEELLLRDLDEAIKIVNSSVEIDITQHQFDALVSLVYNIGAENFKNSTLLKLLNNGATEEAAKQFPRWDHVNGKESDGLLFRRQAEMKLFNS